MPNRKTYPHRIIDRLEGYDGLAPKKQGSLKALTTPIKQRTKIVLHGILAAASAFLLTACGPNAVTVHDADDYPDRLSDWGLVFLDGEQLIISDQSLVYELNTALFSDYALKLRTLYLPEGSQGKFDTTQTFDLPVGSIISKTFLYPKDSSGALLTLANWNGDPSAIRTSDYELIETRLMVRQTGGWDALPYVWDGDDAYLSLTGTIRQMTLSSGEPLNYLVPSKNQCASCHATNHTTGDLMPIGIKARHLDRTTALYNKNQLDLLAERGWLEDVAHDSRANAVWEDTSQSLEHRARSYLDINCGHCHNAQGAADTSGLLLDYEDHPASAMGWCKPPIAAGRGSGGLLYGIVPGRADESILSFRMTTNDPGMMMPELGRSLVHREGLALINDWIDSLEGQCL
jgi:uncharacterized repeat protein (TIGR03806 family)